MILGLGKRYPSVEDEGMVHIKYDNKTDQKEICRNIDGIWKEKHGEWYR